MRRECVRWLVRGNTSKVLELCHQRKTTLLLQLKNSSHVGRGISSSVPGYWVAISAQYLKNECRVSYQFLACHLFVLVRTFFILLNQLALTLSLLKQPNFHSGLIVWDWCLSWEQFEIKMHPPNKATFVEPNKRIGSNLSWGFNLEIHSLLRKARFVFRKSNLTRNIIAPELLPRHLKRRHLCCSFVIGFAFLQLCADKSWRVEGFTLNLLFGECFSCLSHRDCCIHIKRAWTW